MVVGEIVVKLVLSRPLYYLGDDGDDGHGAVV